MILLNCFHAQRKQAAVGDAKEKSVVGSETIYNCLVVIVQMQCFCGARGVRLLRRGLGAQQTGDKANYCHLTIARG